MNFVLNSPMMLLLLPLVAIFAILYIVRSRKTASDIETFAGSAERGRVRKGLYERIKLYLLVSAVLLIVFALSRPAWDPHPKLLQREGRDVVFILDVSNSMLADDIYPNRLERAKMAIADCVESFDGNRIGLVVFAGSAAIECPLTLDNDFFHYMLDKAGPGSVNQGGTRLADAIIKACDKLFSNSKKGYKDIVLITDGGDQGGNFQKAVDILNAKHIKLIVIGIGDASKGSKIPIPGKTVKYMKYNGRDVVTRLESANLRKLVKLCNAGAYLPVGTKNMHLDRIYRQLNSMKRKELLSDNEVTVYEEKFQIFLFAAVVLLVLMVVMPIRGRSKSAIFAILLCFFSSFSINAESANSAAANFAKKDYTAVIRECEILLKRDPSPLLYFKLANACYMIGDYPAALEAYNSAMQEGISKDLLLKILYNRGNCYFKLAKSAEEVEQSLLFFDSAIVSYRKVLFQKREMKEASFNLELALNEREKVIKAMKERDQENEAMKQALQLIGQKLVTLIEAQSDNLVATDDCIKNSDKNDEIRKQLLNTEKDIEKKTGEVTRDSDSFVERFFKGIPKEFSPMGETVKQLEIALDNEKRANKELELAVIQKSSDAEKSALEALKLALKALPAEKQKKQGDEDEKKSSEDENESSDSESDEESDSDSSQSSDKPKIDMKNKQLPPPNESPEDILKRDEEIQKMREKNATGKNQKPVKMDW